MSRLIAPYTANASRGHNNNNFSRRCPCRSPAHHHSDCPYIVRFRNRGRGNNGNHNGRHPASRNVVETGSAVAVPRTATINGRVAPVEYAQMVQVVQLDDE